MEGEGLKMEGPGGPAELQNKKDDAASAKASSGKKRKQREFAFPATDRPARERKSIERLIVSPDKEVKEFKIPKGPGTALKDIPNVVFKLSKRRGNDEVVQTLHRVLFSKTGKTAKNVAKANILQFSGFVWSENEERDKARARERLEKLVKESLVQISDLLDLSSVRSLKKEDAILKVFEFLESPHKTSDKLAEKARKSKKGKKSKKSPVKGSKKKATVKSPRKSPKGATKGSQTEREASDEEDEGDAPDFEDDVEEEPEDKSDDDYAKKTSSSTKKRKRTFSKEEPVQESGDDEEIPPKKKKPIKEAKKEKEKPIPKAKREKKSKAKVDDVKEPSNEALQEAIPELLENADFSKVTFTDVMKQLGEKFNTDLTHRKAYLKALIHEEIQKLVGEGDNEDEEGDNENEEVDNEDEKGKDEDEEGDNEGEIEDNEDKPNRDDEPEEQEDASGGDPKADNEEEDGDEQGVSDRDKEDSDDEKPSGEGEGEDGKSAENKAEDEVEGEDAKGEAEHGSEAEEESTEKA